MVPYLQWELYRYYGDVELLAKVVHLYFVGFVVSSTLSTQHHHKNKKWMALLTSTANDSIISTGLGTSSQ